MPVVEEAKRTIIESDGSIQRLIIVAADFDDQGRYICVAENAAGKAQTEATLAVQGMTHKRITTHFVNAIRRSFRVLHY